MNEAIELNISLTELSKNVWPRATDFSRTPRSVEQL